MALTLSVATRRDVWKMWMSVLFSQSPLHRRWYQKKERLCSFPTTVMRIIQMSVPHIPTVCHSVPCADWPCFCESVAYSCTRSQRLISIQISVSSAVQSSLAVWTEESNQQAARLHLAPIVQFAWHSANSHSVVHQQRLCVYVCVCVWRTQALLP